MKKSKVFIAVNTMNFGGIEKSLLSFLEYINDKAEVDLFIWKPNSISLRIPKYVHMISIPRCHSSLINSLKNNRYVKFRDVICTLKSRKYEKPWLAMKKIKKHYDIAIAYSQQTNLKYFVIDNVSADKKFAFFHNGTYCFADIEKKLDKEYYPKYSKVFAVSENAKKELINIFGKTVDFIVIPNIINNDEIRRLGNYNCEEMDNFDGLKIVSVSRLSSEKNPMAYLKICEKLREMNVKFKFYLIGDGVLKEQMQHGIEEKGLEDCLVLLGNQLNPYKFMKRCDVYVQMSKVEADPLTIREAMVFNKPMVLNDIDAFVRLGNKYDGIKICNYDREDVVDFILNANDTCNSNYSEELNQESKCKIDQYIFNKNNQ